MQKRDSNEENAGDTLERVREENLQAFERKIKQFKKYESIAYEATILIQVVRREEYFTNFNQRTLEELFLALLIQMYADPPAHRISRISIMEKDVPIQVELDVEFIAKIGKNPFHKTKLNPAFLHHQTPEYEAQLTMFLVERRISYPEDFLNLADLANGCFGSVKLVKCKRDNKVYALKIIHRVNDAEARAFVYFDDRNCSQANNLVREIKFLKEIRDIDKIKHPNIVELVCSWCQRGQDKDTHDVFILMQYFGGSSYFANSLYDFFVPRAPDFYDKGAREDYKPEHVKFGKARAREIIGQIFYQALNAIEFLHMHNMAHRDIKDDNFLIRAVASQQQGWIQDRETSHHQESNNSNNNTSSSTNSSSNASQNVFFEVALIDFGLAGSLSKSSSLREYNENSYRDTKNISQYPAACDIYSLGQVLKRLIHLYMHYWHPAEDAEGIRAIFQEQLKAEYELADLMKADIEERPKCIKELKQTPQFIAWLALQPAYLEELFARLAPSPYSQEFYAQMDEDLHQHQRNHHVQMNGSGLYGTGTRSRCNSQTTAQQEHLSFTDKSLDVGENLATQTSTPKSSNGGASVQSYPKHFGTHLAARHRIFRLRDTMEEQQQENDTKFLCPE